MLMTTEFRGKRSTSAVRPMRRRRRREARRAPACAAECALPYIFRNAHISGQSGLSFSSIAHRPSDVNERPPLAAILILEKV